MAISGIASTVHRVDDHTVVHDNQTPTIHFVGHFVIWHQYFPATYKKTMRDECGNTSESMKVYETAVFDPVTGFGGNAPFVQATSEQNPPNVTGSTGGECVEDSPFVASQYMPSFPEPGYLCHDFISWIMSTFSDPALVQKPLEQPDNRRSTFQHEGTPSLEERNIHGDVHFGAGSVLRDVGNVANSPSDPLFCLHHGEPIEPFDCSGMNITLDFTIKIGKFAGDATLKDLLNMEGRILCFIYAS
ncbi:monooxygenase [Phaeosphaeria sp. MPI-PUGE-AT-0046c]|nr:monooxygenase [Phaeosphaeria sp. MPI-PUGE-AT-0046c]